MGKGKIDSQAASRMKSTGDRKTSNPTAKTGFAPRTQSSKSTNGRNNKR